jgi:hypothetical protein
LRTPRLGAGVIGDEESQDSKDQQQQKDDPMQSSHDLEARTELRELERPRENHSGVGVNR